MAIVPSSTYKYIGFFIFLLFGKALLAQDSLQFINTLAPELLEISGLVKTKNNQYLAIADSDNPPHIYVLDSVGNIVKTVEVSNATNVDWESLTKNDRGIVYIGDIGNNYNNRKDLTIYGVFEDDILTKSNVQSGAIQIKYKDQKAFPPSTDKLNYDAESLVSFNNQLYLFTKNRTEPYTGYTYLYAIPPSTKLHEIKKVDSLYTGSEMAASWITDATLSPDKRHLVLLSQDRFFIISDFYKDHFFSGIITEIPFSIASQKESVCFYNDTTLIIADERQTFFGGNLYQYSIAKNLAHIDSIRKWEVTVNTDTSFVDTLWADFDLWIKAEVYYEVFNQNMNRVDFGKIGVFNPGKQRVPIHPNIKINGHYMLNIIVGNRPHGFFVYRFEEVDFEKLKEENEN